MNNGRRRCAFSVRLAYAIGAGCWAMASAACSSSSGGPPDSGSSLDSGGSTDVIPEVDSAPSCPPSQSQPTCPVAPGAIDCARHEIGCGLDSLPTGLACSAPAQCSALIYPCPDWQSYVPLERTDGYICSCVGGRWSCDDCWLGTALCVALDGSPFLQAPVADAASDGPATDSPVECTGRVCGAPCCPGSADPNSCANNAGWFCNALGACALPTDANRCPPSADGAAGE
jgi:hypothetical protein